ncbi:hypothetical protein F2P81_020917 [Scophthalmus maximus]|uniref:Neuropilin C-terminal domain-containing protein n=1 Tax=Scophthalmus maximus TaxID=52904 RepID=A0A6A4S3F2_SCOMX|nr:hypothetical protein F2P81_020917 [Scophthalmus maximus]
MDFGKDPVYNSKHPVNGDYVFPGWPSSFSTPSSSDVDPPSVTLVSEKDKDNAWLYTLDPILLTIIVMSSLGVLMGAVCAGLLLYCTCSYSGLSSRSSTTLENYNFELYDGIKHKVKINQQRLYDAQNEGQTLCGQNVSDCFTATYGLPKSYRGQRWKSTLKIMGYEIEFACSACLFPNLTFQFVENIKYPGHINVRTINTTSHFQMTGSANTNVQSGVQLIHRPHFRMRRI